MINSIAFSIFFYSSLLVYGNNTDFYMLSWNPATLENLFIIYMFLKIPKYFLSMIMPSVNKGNLTSFFQSVFLLFNIFALSQYLILPLQC